MSEVLDFGTSYAEAQQTVADLISQMVEHAQEVAQQSDAIEESENALADAKSQATQMLEGLGSEVEQTSEQTDNAREGVESASESLQDAADSGGDTFGELKEAVDDAHNELSDEVGQTLDATSQLHETAVAAVDSAISTTSETAGQMQETAELTYNTLGEVASSVTMLTGRMTEMGADTVSKGADLAGKITEDVTSRFEGLFGDVTDALGTEFFDQAVAGFEGLTSNVDDLYSNFESVVDGLGENLSERMGEIFTDTISHVQDEAATRIEEEGKEFVSDAVEFMLSEVAENLAMATLGGTITGLLGPALPVVVALKALVGAIKAALELLKKFGL